MDNKLISNIALAAVLGSVAFMVVSSVSKGKGACETSYAGSEVKLSISQVLLMASKAGFKGKALTTIVAIAIAESGLHPHILSTCPGTGNQPSRDRGLWQINDLAHPEVSELQAFTGQLAAHAAYRISNKGTDFTPWVTYNNESYRQYIHDVEVAMGAEGFTLLDYLYPQST